MVTPRWDMQDPPLRREKPCRKVGKEVAGRQEQGLVGQVPPARGAERQTEKKKQLVNPSGWGESCWACLPKGQGITHVPVPRWKGKFPEACLICLSILNPSLAPSQVWVLVEELKNDAEKASPCSAWWRAGSFCLSSIRKARVEIIFPA